MSGLGGGVGASGLGPDCKDGAKAVTVVWILVLNYEYFYPLKQIVQNPLLLERHLLGIPRTTRTLKPRGKWWSSRFTVLQLNSSSMQDPIPYTQGMIKIPLIWNLMVTHICQKTNLKILTKVYLQSIHTALEEC